MAYGLKYRLQFKDILNNDVRVDFFLKDYSGGLSGYLRGSAGNELILKRNLGSGGEPEYIDSHEFSIEFIPTESINLNTFRSKSNKKWMLKVYINDEQFYWLWLINTDARQPMNFKRGEPVRLTATDGLGLLKSEHLSMQDVQSVWVDPSTGEYLYIYPYQESPPSPPSGWVEEQVTLDFPIFGEISYLDALALCLKKVGFDINIAVVCGITTDWIEALSTSTHPLKLIKIYASVFEGKSVYEILQILCVNMNCIVSQYDGRWFFWRPNELYYTYYSREIFDKDGNAIGSESAKPILSAGSYANTDKLFYINNNHDTYFFEPYKAITATCEYAKPIQLIDPNYLNGNISKYGSDRIDFDIIKEYSLMGFRLYRESSSIPFSFISLPTFKIYDGESFDIELYYKSHGSNDNKLCVEIEAIEEGNPYNRIFKYTNFKSVDEGDKYSTNENGYSAQWVGAYERDGGTVTSYLSFDGSAIKVFSENAKYLVESVDTKFESNNFDYQKLTINIPAILIPFTSTYVSPKLIATNVTVRIYSMATSTDGNIAVGSSISVGGFDVRKHINRSDKSDNCKVEINEQCDYEPKTIDLNFVDDPESANYTHRIGNGSQYWKRPNRSENKALFEILAEDRFNLRTHDVPNIEGDFRFDAGFPIWNRFEFPQYDGAMFVPWDVQLNFQNRVCSGLFVPILDADSSHKVTFYTTNQNDKEVVYLRKNITI